MKEHIIVGKANLALLLHESVAEVNTQFVIILG